MGGAAVAAGRPRVSGSRILEYFLQQLINGLTLGAIYGLIAIGYTMVYGIIGMINFAHGEIYMIAAFISLITFLVLGMIGVTWLPLALLLVLVSAMFFTAFYGWTLERIAYRPLRASPRLTALISAIGMSIFLQNYVQILQGARVKSLPPVLPGGFSLMEKDGFVVSLSYLQIGIILLTIVLMAAFSLLISRTPMGRAQRACEQDMKMASLIGINVDRTISTTFVIGAALAAVAGMMVMLYIGSLPGAMLGGVLIGLIEVFWSAYFTLEYKDVAAFSILVLVLIFRPTGLLGRPEAEKV
jgi:branched-chain amino acid transport system permease protein